MASPLKVRAAVRAGRAEEEGEQEEVETALACPLRATSFPLEVLSP